MVADGVLAEVAIAHRAEAVLLRRLKVALFAAVIIPVLLLFAGAWDEHAQLLRVAEEQAVTTVTALREHALKAIETHELLVRELDHRLQGMSWDEIRESSEVLSAEIEAMRAGLPEVSAMTAVDAEGIRQVGSGVHARDGVVSLKKREYWAAQHGADQGTFISAPYIGLMSGLNDFAISRRRTSTDGNFIGTVHVSVTASYFTTFWSQVVAGQHDATIALVRLDGTILARFPEEPGRHPPLIIGQSPLLRHIEADPQGGVFRADATPDGIDRIYGYSKVGSYPLVVVYKIPLQTVFVPWWRHLLMVGGVGLLGSAAIVIAVLGIMQQVHRLIREQARRGAIEQAVQKGQRLALLGQFAAGVSHDFANILQSIGAVASMLQHHAGRPERVRSLADQLEEDVERGTSLTHRMLDLVRRNGSSGESEDGNKDSVINPAGAISRLSEMLPRLVSPGYRLRYELEDNLPPLIRGNGSDFELAIMNLVINARDAMADGGEIVIRADGDQTGTTPYDLTLNRRDDSSAQKGYLRISVADSGTGMAPDVLAQAGMVFFTTKSPGKGTGLGLANARTFAERDGGRMTIESDEGHGTTVTLWLPVTAPIQASDAEPVERAL